MYFLGFRLRGGFHREILMAWGFKNIFFLGSQIARGVMEISFRFF